MNGKHFAQRIGSKRNLLAVLASSAIFTAGCSNMMTTGPTATPLTSGGQLSGNVYGGSQPVSGARVTLYYAGQSGYGSGVVTDPVSANGAAIVAATTTSADDGHGSFSFSKNPLNGQPSSGNSFSCPASGDPLVYVIARGGNTLNTHDTGVDNTAAAFLAVFGNCSQINASSFVSMTEVTTVATMVALQQYFNPVTESFGADGIAVSKQAITNVIATISNLANVAAGTAAGPNCYRTRVGGRDDYASDSKD